MLTATPEAVAAAEAVGVGARVAVTTSPAAPSLARQALRAGSWQAAVVVAAPAERRG
jgi:hypothetical protein